MSDSESPVKRYELDALAAELKRDREQAKSDTHEIKELLKENNRIMREAITGLRTEFNKKIEDIEKDYVKTDKLTIKLAAYEPIRKFFWWFAGSVGIMFLATVYQLLINGVKSL